MSKTDRLYTISEVAKAVNRASHTVRVWQYEDRLPEHLRPARNERGWRVWTLDQINGIKQWIIDEDLRPGKGLEKSRMLRKASK